jgi:GH43 family beta-xylosidase
MFKVLSGIKVFIFLIISIILVLLTFTEFLYSTQLNSTEYQKGENFILKSIEYENPIIEQRADPWVYKHSDGYYYFTASVPEYDRIEIRRAKTIQELGSVDGVTIWRKHNSGEMSVHIWAPEIHYIKGKWYIYYAAGGLGGDIWGIRPYVLECSDENPLTGNWQEKGIMKKSAEDDFSFSNFSLDATTFIHNEVRYFVWAQKTHELHNPSNLYIAEMENPWTIKGKTAMIATPEFNWEKRGFWVNEGPAVLKRNNRIFISFSASATDSNYCMGLLSASDTADLLNPKSWSKSPEPVFKTSEENSQYGPGHNSFTVSEDNSKDVLIYHARNYRYIVGDPLYDPNRHTRAQVFDWNVDGTPNFGTPVPDYQ